MIDHEGNEHLSIPFERISLAVTENVVCDRVAAEVRKALVEDEGFRILVREGVREAMSKLNVAEVVALAVKEVLGQTEIAHTHESTERKGARSQFR